MNRVNNEEEREWSSLVSRIIGGQDWWTSSTKLIPERIGFQRFGMQLRDEDFQQDGTFYRGFLIRDRTEARVAASGYSAFRNGDKEFQVALDVWPFQHRELLVVIVPGVHIMIDGEHKEKCEDNSECTRKFTRRYMLPKGCASKVRECNYNKGILTITVEKSEIINKEEKPQTVPITLDSWKKIRSKPFEGNNDAPVTFQDPQEVAITDDDSERNLAEDDETSKATLASGDSSKVDPGEVAVTEVPTANNESKVHPEVVAETSMKGPVANADSNADLAEVVTPETSTTASDESNVDSKEVVETPKAVPTANDGSKVDPGEVATPEVPVAKEDSKVDPKKVVETPKAEPTAKDDSKVEPEVVDNTSQADSIATDDSNVDLAEVVTPKSSTIAKHESNVDSKEVVETPKAATCANDESKVDSKEVVKTPKAATCANDESKVDPGEVQTQKAAAVADDV